MHASSTSRLLIKRSSLQAKQTALASYIGSGPYNALTADQKANVNDQNAKALGTITSLSSRILRKTGH